MEVTLLKPRVDIDPASIITRLERLRVKKGDVVILYVNTLMNIKQDNLVPLVMGLSRDTKCPVAVLPQGVSVQVVEAKVVEYLRKQVEKQYREEFERRRKEVAECPSTSTGAETAEKK